MEVFNYILGLLNTVFVVIGVWVMIELYQQMRLNNDVLIRAIELYNKKADERAGEADRSDRQSDH